MLSILLPSSNEPGVSKFAEELSTKFPDSEIIIANDRDRRGKGWAIREAFSVSKGEYIAFLDGDAEIPARMLSRLLPFLEDFDVVVGSKRITNAPLRRKIMTHVTRICFKFLFGLKQDSQTGIKLFKRKALESLKYGWASNAWLFDVEILVALQAKGFKIVEVPIEAEIRRQLAFKTIFKITKESILLRWRLWFPS